MLHSSLLFRLQPCQLGPNGLAATQEFGGDVGGIGIKGDEDDGGRWKGRGRVGEQREATGPTLKRRVTMSASEDLGVFVMLIWTEENGILLG